MWSICLHVMLYMTGLLQITKGFYTSSTSPSTLCLLVDQEDAAHFGTQGCTGAPGNTGLDVAPGPTYNKMALNFSYTGSSPPTFVLSGQQGQQGGAGRKYNEHNQL